jgi:two-component system, OmpR family, alkaline phosphatase synthesis response regulator PhoP
MEQKKILVADDESHILHVVSLKLRNAGFTVVTACDGQEAFELAGQEKPDLMVIDYQMPHLSGLELCQKLKQSPATGRIPAVLLTARGYDLDLGVAQESGIVRILSKPFSPRQLLATVNEILAEVPA